MTPRSTDVSARPSWLFPMLVATATAALLVRLPALLGGSDALPEHADAIYVFPGEIPARPLCGVEFWRRGVAPTVVFTGGSLDRSLSALGDVVTDAELGARIARRAGLPPQAEVVLDQGTSTWEDAIALAAWARGRGARSVVAVTSPLHARRARRSLGYALAGTGTVARVVACGPRLDGTAWWWDERLLVAVAVEAAKTILYEIRYFLPARLGLRPGQAEPAMPADPPVVSPQPLLR